MPRGAKGEKCLAESRQRCAGHEDRNLRTRRSTRTDYDWSIKRLNSFKSYAVDCFHLDIPEVRNRGGQTLPFLGARSMIDRDFLISTQSFRGAYGTQVVAANADAA